jgi:dCMP deaminase
MKDDSNRMSEKRPSWHEYFMGICDLVATRSTCIRRSVGAVLIKDKRILCTGYNGAPAGIPHCRETGCMREIMNVPSGEKHELCRGVHAEQNAIIQAAFHGISLKEASLYCSNLPCSICAKMLINAGIKTIYYADDYHDPLALEMLKMGRIKLIHIEICSNKRLE